MVSHLFITDFDGTLLNDRGTISDRDIATLNALREKDVAVAIATGRSQFSFERALGQMNRKCLPMDYLLFSTGAGVLDTTRNIIIRSRSISRQDTRSIINYFDRAGVDYMIHKSIPDTPYFLYKCNQEQNDDFRSRIALYQQFASPLISDVYEEATQVLAVIPRGRPAPPVEEIRSKLKTFSVIQATSPLDHASVWIEVFHPDVSKSRTAKWLSDRLGIDPRQVVAVGNDYNDQDLLSWSGKAYATANSVKGLSGCERLRQSNNQSAVTGAARAGGLI